MLDIYDSDDDDDQWKDIDELNCMSDPLDATDVPVDTDGDYVCDVQDADDDGDGFDDADELQCQTDPLDETSTPSDMDNDGLCDPLDDDVDGDGVDNENDSHRRTLSVGDHVVALMKAPTILTNVQTTRTGHASR